MKRLLVINATSDKVNSKTYFVYKDVLAKLDTSGFTIDELDLIDMQLPILDPEILKAKKHRALYTDLDKQIEELAVHFCNSDGYIFIFPTWNLNVPAVLKVYLDLVCDEDKVFRRTEFGTVGILDNKKAILINSSGGVNRGAIDYMNNLCTFMHLHPTEVFIDNTRFKYDTKMAMLKDYHIPVDHFQD